MKGTHPATVRAVVRPHVLQNLLLRPDSSAHKTLKVDLPITPDPHPPGSCRARATARLLQSSQFAQLLRMLLLDARSESLDDGHELLVLLEV